MNKEQGQTLIIVAGASLALFGILLLVINVGALYSAGSALDRATESAALAALQPMTAGRPDLDATVAEQRAREVLTAELHNVRGLTISPADAAQSASVTVSNPGADGCVWNAGICYHGALVTVRVEAEVCAPLHCQSMRRENVVALEANVLQPPPATPVPGLVIPITPTP